MNEQHSKWLTKELAKIFSEGVREAILGATLQKELIKAYRCFPYDFRKEALEKA